MNKMFKGLIKFAFIVFTILLIWDNIEMKNQIVIERNKNIELRSRDEYRFIGYVIRKHENNKRYYIDVVGYGKYEVSDVEYYETQIGELCSEHIIERGRVHD